MVNMLIRKYSLLIIQLKLYWFYHLKPNVSHLAVFEIKILGMNNVLMQECYLFVFKKCLYFPYTFSCLLFKTLFPFVITILYSFWEVDLFQCT